MLYFLYTHDVTMISTIIAATQDMYLFLQELVFNPIFVGFLAGSIVSILAVGLILTKNPKHIPTILRYSSTESFHKISGRTKDGTYTMGFAPFLRVYALVRILFLLLVIAFFSMVTTVLFTYR